MSPSYTLIPGEVEILPGHPHDDTYPADAVGLHGALATLHAGPTLNLADSGGTSTLKLEIGLQNSGGTHKLGGGILVYSDWTAKLYTVIDGAISYSFTFALFPPGSPGVFNLQLQIIDTTQEVMISVWNHAISGPYVAQWTATPAALLTDVPSIPYDHFELLNSDPALSNAYAGEYAFTGSDLADPNTITVAAHPNSIPADGTSQSTVTAMLRDKTGVGVHGQTVTFTPASHFTGAAVIDNGDGTYDITYTSDTNPGMVEVQAAAETRSSGTIRASTSIQQRPQGDIHAGPPQVGLVKRGGRG